jgi:RNA polymerase sigma-70 factor (ECF subfamily)
MRQASSTALRHPQRAGSVHAQRQGRLSPVTISGSVDIVVMSKQSAHRTAEERFALVFAHLDEIVEYARRRGALDCEAVAAEAMAIAWRRLGDVPVDDPLPWLIVTARNLLFAQWRQQRALTLSPDLALHLPAAEHPFPAVELDPELEVALLGLSEADREALLLIAWEDLTPRAAAAALGISSAAFRVRLHRARTRLLKQLARTRSNTTAENQPTPIEEL